MIYGKLREYIKDLRTILRILIPTPKASPGALSGVQAVLVDCDDIRTLSVNGIEK
jgi:hypothetical protein